MKGIWNLCSIFITFLKSSIIPKQIKYIYLHIILNRKHHMNMALIKGKVHENKT